MNNQGVAKLIQRLEIGRFYQTEDENGCLKDCFDLFKEVWAEIKPLSLLNQSNPKSSFDCRQKVTKHVYLIKIRENVISRARHEMINAVRWKHKILTNFYSLGLDSSGIYLEGLFYDQGQESSI